MKGKGTYHPVQLALSLVLHGHAPPVLALTFRHIAWLLVPRPTW